MSCYLVGKTHIDALVSAALAEEWRGAGRVSGELRWRALGNRHVVYGECANGLGETLWRTNYDSVVYRYGPPSASNQLPGPVGLTLADIEAYEYEAIGGLPNALIVLNAIAGYTYQSCEHPAWEVSDAAAVCDALALRAAEMLPGRDCEPGWSIETLADYDPEGAMLAEAQKIEIEGVTIAYMSHENEHPSYGYER